MYKKVLRKSEKMKRIVTIIFAILFCLTLPVVCYADNIYIVEDEEDEFVPQVPATTTKPAETTTAKTESIFGDTEGLDSMLGGFSGMLGDGIDSILSGFEGLGDFNFNFGEEDDTPEEGLQPINPGEAETVRPAVTTNPDGQAQNGQAVQGENTTKSSQQNEELPSVLIVNQGNTSDDRISGSTLTLLVFVAAIVIIILAGAIVLVIMTKRTEYNSSVRSRSTIPGVEQPSALAQFFEDDIKDDGKDYGNINYWENE